MVNILLALDKEVRREAMYNRIEVACNKMVKEKGIPMKRKIFLLVPEQATFNTARALCERLGNKLANRVRVIGFEQLLELVYAECGNRREYMDEGGRLLAMAVATANSKTSLTVFQALSSRPEYAKDLVATYNTMQYHRVRQDLAQGSETVKSDILRKKLTDLDTIFSAYEEICAKTALDPTDRIEHIASILRSTDWLQGTQWFIDDYIDFTALQYDLLTPIVSQADEVTIALAAESLNDVRPSSKHPVRTAHCFINIAANSYHVETLEDSDRKRGAALTYLQKELCNNTHPVCADLEAGDDVQFFFDSTPYNECVHVAAELMKDIRSGCRYKDISVVLCQYDRYAPTLAAVLRKYDIPAYFGSTREDVGKNPVLLTLIAALTAVTRGMAQEDVLQYLKSGLSTLTRDEANMLEEYVRAYRIHGRAWEPGEDGWVMNPSGVHKELSEEDTEYLETLNALRVKGIQPLLTLRDALKTGNTISDYAESLCNFLEDTEFDTRLQDIVDKLQDTGEIQLAKEYAQVSEVLATVMEQMYEVGKSLEKSAGDFVKLFKLVCTSYKIATTPIHLDEVEVLALQDARYTSAKKRYILGAEEGFFPAFDTTATMLDNHDLAELEAVGLDLPGTDMDITQRGLSDIYVVLSGAQEKLVLSYAAETPANATPSYLVERAQVLLKNSQPVRGAIPEYGGLYEADLMTPVAAGKLMGRLTFQEKYDPLIYTLATIDNPILQVNAARVIQKATWTLNDLSEESVEGLYGANLPLSATRTDVYSSCRYHYFLKYGLHIRVPHKGFLDSPIFGSFAHAVLEKTMRELVSLHTKEAPLPMDQVNRILRKHIDAYTSENMRGLEHQSEQYIYHYKWQCRELLAIVQNTYNELKKSDFVPVEFEYRVGGEDADMPGMPIFSETGLRGTFSGIMDRVDTCTLDDRTYFRVIDYKTGKVQTCDLNDILHGFGLQILLYINALEHNRLGLDGATASAAGALYTPTKDVIISSPKKLDEEKLASELDAALRRHGVLLNDKDVLHAMENFGEENPQYLPVKVSKDGTLSGDLYSEDEIQTLVSYAKNRLSDMLTEISSGSVQPNPISHGKGRTSCARCPFRQACPKDILGTRYRYFKKEKPEDAMRKIEQEVERKEKDTTRDLSRG